MTLSKTLRTAAGLLVIAVGSSALASGSYTSPHPTDDAMIFATSSGVDTTNASGKGPGMFAGADGSSNIKRSLVRFDLAGHIGGTPLTAQLDLVIGQIAGSGGMFGCGTMCTPPTRTFEIYEVDYTTAWAEGQTGATACPPSGTPKFQQRCAAMSGTGQGWAYETTCSGLGVDPSCSHDVGFQYIDYTNSTVWQNYAGSKNQDFGTGSFGSPSYGNHTAAGSWTFSSFTIGNTMSFYGDGTTNTGFLNMVKDWVATTAHNNGMMIREPALESTAVSFIGWYTQDGATMNGNNAALNPKLTVTW